MTGVRKFHVRSRLSIEAFKRKGVMAIDAIEAADQALAGLAPACEAELDRILAAISQTYQGSLDRSNLPFEPLYDQVCCILDVIVALPGTGMEKAALSLCQLIDLCWAEDVWDWQAVDVHLRALQVLRLQGARMSPAAREQVIDGLGKVYARTFACLSKGPDQGSARVQ